MNKPTLFETPFAAARSLNKELTGAVVYLTKYYPLVHVDNGFLNDVKTYSSTATSMIFNNLKAAEKIKHFMFYNLGKSANTPSILTINDISIDGKAIPDISIPDTLKKCWINLTPIISQKDSYNGRINVTDVTELANIMTRGALTNSYHNSKDLWLSPNLSTYVIEFYSGVISNTLGQVYNLNYDERLYVQTLFAAYYAQCLGGEKSPLDMPPLLFRCTFLGSVADITDRMNSIQESRDNDGDSYLYPSVICKILAKHGPARMNKFDPVYLYRHISATAMDSQIMLIALDFPPYWVYQMLRVAHGYKNPIMSNMLKLTGTKIKLQQFAKDMAESDVIIRKVN